MVRCYAFVPFADIQRFHFPLAAIPVNAIVALSAGNNSEIQVNQLLENLRAIVLKDIRYSFFRRTFLKGLKLLPERVNSRFLHKIGGPHVFRNIVRHNDSPSQSATIVAFLSGEEKNYFLYLEISESETAAERIER
jgi:hypothetical protein